MPYNRFLFVVFALLTSFSMPANAQTQETVLRVGITAVPPFVMTDADGNWEGISIDLWRTIAEDLGQDYEFVELSFEQLLDGVESGNVDIAVGALTMTADRESRFDFAHPFYQTGLSIGVPHNPSGGLWQSFRALFTWQFASLIGSLGLLLLFVGVLLWLVERRRNPEQFGGTPIEGIGSSFWWAAVTMTTVGYGDKAPTSLPGRLIALVWMFAGLIMVASFTAAITSSLTVSNLQRHIEGPLDLPGNTVATIANTASARFLKEERIRHETYPDLTTAMQAVAREEVDAVVYDRALMQYRNQQLGNHRLDILPAVFEQQLYAFALPSGSPNRAAIAQQVLRVTESPEWETLLQRYLGR
ncbi:transporter substrate-binding domain-containing protein [Halopseudomonas salina]|uniref:Amino acid ABC transporter substrate-binding protein n=1 Tax=Halopseudomonas salina TaxID=1323744 RepID=A0ABQ1P8C4_9GAMM|nr:transporter substrate-binding domain-containing protein [Halopseudomonas salina]GGC92680.1 amino acid ABC transporter substrate-binding protein [Halopseudomonas salina]